jgi:hypothetical protein
MLESLGMKHLKSGERREKKEKVEREKMTLSRGWSSKVQRLQIFFYSNKTMSTIDYKEGKCEKCERQPVTIGISLFKTPQLKEHQVLTHMFGVFTN